LITIFILHITPAFIIWEQFAARRDRRRSWKTAFSWSGWQDPGFLSFLKSPIRKVLEKRPLTAFRSITHHSSKNRGGLVRVNLPAHSFQANRTCGSTRSLYSFIMPEWRHVQISFSQ
jgi:hypothetical protein